MLPWTLLCGPQGSDPGPHVCLAFAFPLSQIYGPMSKSLLQLHSGKNEFIQFKECIFHKYFIFSMKFSPFTLVFVIL